MQYFVLLVVIALMQATHVGCSDLGQSDGGPMTDNQGHFTDDPPATMAISLGCMGNVGDEVVLPMFWELTVDPGPIVGGEAFGAVFRGKVVLDRDLLNLAQTLVFGGYTRSNVFDVKATVHVRDGVQSGGEDVVLAPARIDRTCRYDDDGDEGIDAGPFPRCSAENDNEDGSNEDCIGLGGAPSPSNHCGEFNDLIVSDDCAPDGACDQLGQAARDACNWAGFCVVEPSETPVEGSVKGYVAQGSGNVLFGWADESTSAVFDETSGTDGAWVLTRPVFEEPTGPNGFRSESGDEKFAIECTMGVGTEPLERTPDSDLISFEIQRR